MEWEKAKNLILLFFVLLNIALAGYLFAENRRYTVSAEHEDIIRTVLARHDITMETDMIRRFPPMRALRISGYYYDEDMLTGIFFGDDSRVIREETPFGVDFTLGNAQMWITDGFVTYFNPDGLDTTAESIIARHFPEFVLDEFFTPHDEEGRRIVYRQSYRGHIIYSNVIEFLVTDAGIIEVDMQFGRVHGFDDLERSLFAPDEALITFMQRAHTLLGTQPKTIWHMDIVYVLEFAKASDERGSSYLAIPFYRIFIRCSELPFLINAYMNISIDA
ncbi:MAG: hypothetical protein FWE90_08940 [Defluviitaleaceae bacterium]|nr:hypothetical protein [Defluviitaleaceae bacterium]